MTRQFRGGRGTDPLGVHRHKFCLNAGLGKKYSWSVDRRCAEFAWRLTLAILPIFAVARCPSAELSLKVEPADIIVGSEVVVTAVPAGGIGIRWRWNDKLKGERMQGDRVVLRALHPGEGAVFARTDAGEWETRFQIHAEADKPQTVARMPGAVGAETPEATSRKAPSKTSEADQAPSQERPKSMAPAAGESRSVEGELVVEKHPSGARSAEGRMKDGRREGVWTFWDEGGKKSGEGEYRSGDRHGTWKEWDEKGNLVVEGLFESDRETRRTETRWDDKGRKVLAETVTRAGDSEVKETVEWGWHDNGKLMGEKRIRDGVRHGEWKLWDEAGGPVMSVVFTNGWALPSEEALKTPVGKKAGEIYLGVIGLGTNDFPGAAALAGKLSGEEQEALSRMAFKALGSMDDDETGKFERLFRLVIDTCPETGRAHEAHWRLTHMYQQAFDPPAHEKIVPLLEGFLARYKESKIVSMEKYPEEALVFSPLRSLHQSYEALKQWDKIAAYYNGAVAAKAPLKPADQFDYAKALDEMGNKEGAIKWYQNYLKAEPDKESFMVEIAGDRVKELRGQ